MQAGTPDFELVTELIGHEADVRCIAALADPTGGSAMRLVSGSRDRFAKIWGGDVAGRCFKVEATVFEHQHFVNSVLALPPGALGGQLPEGGFATGCQDKLVRIFNRSGELLRTLDGHTGSVCSLSLHASGMLISGSWDGTARVWNAASGECVSVLKDHENAVCVLGLPNGVVVTGSAGEQQGSRVVGMQLRFWREGQLVKSSTEHTHSVRALVLLGDGSGFASTSNDGTTRHWSFDGELLQTMENPTPETYNYDVVYLSMGELATACEDCCVRIWRNGECVQQIGHPCTVWGVSLCPNGDLATAGSDGTVRVFTRCAERSAPQEVRSYYASQVETAIKAIANKANPKESTDPNKYPKIFDAKPGTSEGEVKIFNKDGVATVYQWMGTTWVEVGQMMGEAEDEDDEGNKFDRVIPVELEMPGGKGLRKLKLGFNNADNPWVVAQQFVEKHQLGEEHVSQIAEFVQAQRGVTSAPTIGLGTDGDGVAPMDVEGGTSSVPAPRTYDHFPLRGGAGLAFEKGNLNAAFKKLGENSDALADEAARLTTDESAALSSLVGALLETSRYHSSTVPRDALATIARIVKAWPPPSSFPALDLARAACGHPDAATKLGAEGGPSLAATALKNAALSGAPMAVTLLGLRLASSMFKAPPSSGSAALDAVADGSALSTLRAAGLARHTNKNIRVALATLTLNVANALYHRSSYSAQIDAAAAAPASMALAITLLEDSAASNGALFDKVTTLRALAAAGTVLLLSETSEVPPGLIAAMEALEKSCDSLLGTDERACMAEVRRAASSMNRK